MQKRTFALCNILAALSIGAILIAAPLCSAQAADAGKDQSEALAQQRQKWIRAKVDRDANRLEIKASQQAAWEDYANARKALAETTFTKLPENADAAAIARQRAERVSSFAQKLTKLAEATEKLQAVLSPEQRKTLDQIVRQAHCGHGHHGRHGGHRGLLGDGSEQGMDKSPLGKGQEAKDGKPQAKAQPGKK
jgi:cell wall-associated NlpC family hydrolase